MNHIWTVLCQKSSIDIETNLLSLFNCVEELSIVIDDIKAAEKNIIIPVDFQLVSFWIIENPKQDNVLDIRGELLDPNGKVLNQFENRFEIKAGVLRFRNRTNLQGLPVTEAGRYQFRLRQKKAGKNDFEVMADIPLDVKISYKLLEKPAVKA